MNNTMGLMVIGIACITLIMITAILMGHDGMLVTSAIGIIAGILGIGGGVKVGANTTKSKVNAYLAEVERSQKWRDEE